MATKKIDESPVFQLKVTLKRMRPPIWRRIQVRGSTTLNKLHDILQIVLGWYNCHLHLFTARGIVYGAPPVDVSLYSRNEGRVRLGEIVAREKDRFLYEYDFGDSWEYTIDVEKVLAPEPDVRYPICLGGRRACPPEDVGGVWGYQRFLEVIRDPTHPDHTEILEWAGGPFDPEAFNVEAINETLRYYFR